MTNTTQYSEVTLDNIGSGAAVEMFQMEFEKVLANIADVNTKGDAMREITLKVKIKPDQDGDKAMIGVECSSKLAPTRGVSSMVYLGKNKGKLTAYENNFKQELLPGTETAPLKEIKAND